MASTLSEEQAARRVRSGTWSAAEVLDHLVRTEVAYRKYQLQVLDRASAGVTGTVRIDFREVDTRLRPLPKSWMPLLAPLLYALHAVTPFRIRLAVMRKPGLLWAAALEIAEVRTASACSDDLPCRSAQKCSRYAIGLCSEGIFDASSAGHSRGTTYRCTARRQRGADHTARGSAHEERHQHQLHEPF